MNPDIIFYQLFEPESSTYTYIIADKGTKEAAIIDPVLETVERDLKLVNELGLQLKYILDTHIHADHITGAGELRQRTQAQTGVSREAGVNCVNLALRDEQILTLGDKKIEVLETPGHTNTCLSFHFSNMVFTGDSLMIRGTGRTDFQQGSSDKLYQSVREKLFSLPDETILYPGHDYRGQTKSTLGLEKKFNPRLNEKTTLEEFKKTMAELKLANPKKIMEAVPANLLCGITAKDRGIDAKDREVTVKGRALPAQMVDGIPEVSCQQVHSHAGKQIRIIDVRNPNEFNNELGHIAGAELKVLGPELLSFLETADRDEEIIFVCRSGSRSGHATSTALQMGFKFPANMAGGMLRWNELRLPKE